MKMREKLKKLRTQSQFTQQQLSDELGISQMTYARYESGTRQPNKKNLKVLCDYFEVPIEYLLDDDFELENPTKYFDDFKKYLVRLQVWENEIEQLEYYLSSNEAHSKVMIKELLDSAKHKKSSLIKEYKELISNISYERILKKYNRVISEIDALKE
jgi:transcriptional regulator with XRE-family HTH domain